MALSSSNVSPTCRANEADVRSALQTRPRPGSPPAPTAGAFFFGEFVTSTAPAPQSEPLPGSPRRRTSPRLLWLTQQSRDFKDADRPLRPESSYIVEGVTQ
jgi:hypothetical protein